MPACVPATAKALRAVTAVQGPEDAWGDVLMFWRGWATLPGVLGLPSLPRCKSGLRPPTGRPLALASPQTLLKLPLAHAQATGASVYAGQCTAAARRWPKRCCGAKRLLTERAACPGRSRRAAGR